MPLSKRTDFGDAKYAGVEVDDRASYDIPGALSAVLDAGFDFVVAPLALEPTQPRSRFHRGAASSSVTADPSSSASFGTGGDGAPPPPWAPSDLLLPSSAWSSQVVGKVSTWINCDCDADPRGERGGDDGKDRGNANASAVRQLALDSEAALAQELAWAGHLSLQAVILQPPASSHSQSKRPRLGPNGARAVCSGLRGLGAPAVWLRLPLWWRREGDETGTDQEEEDPWHSWDELRHGCEHSARLGVMLDLPAKIDSDPFNGGGGDGGGVGEGEHPAVAALRRWVGEPLKAVFLPSAAFLANRRGFPSLTRVHQELLQVAFAAGVQVVMSGAPEIVPPATNEENGGGSPDPLSAAASAAKAAREYLSHVFRRPGPPALPGGPAPAMTEEDDRRLREDLAGYRDFLQAPLQPLQDDLESSTYETFERDAPKYEAYREAVACCLADRLAAGKSPPSSAEEEGGDAATVVIMVVGAGRGPLVRASLAAADSVGCRVRVYAVEKNPNAVITLQGLLATEPGWRGRVCVVARDMRRWRAPEPADVLVSELLGSFGDNELSPECLDGAQRFLKKGSGVSIPASYTSFLEPVTAAKPWGDARGSAGGGGDGGDGGGGRAAAAAKTAPLPFRPSRRPMSSTSIGSPRALAAAPGPRSPLITRGRDLGPGREGKKERKKTNPTTMMRIPTPEGSPCASTDRRNPPRSSTALPDTSRPRSTPRAGRDNP